MYPLITANVILVSVANLIRTTLNSGHWFRLFQNSFVPNPGTMLSEFLEANYVGYAPFNLVNAFGPPVKQSDGIYVLTGQSGLFGCESGTQTVYGAYIDDGSKLKFCQVFSTPMALVPGSSFVVPLSVQSVSMSIFGM